MAGVKYIKLLGLMIGVALVNIVVLSPGLLGVEIGGSPFATAFGVTLLVASGLALLYGSYVWLFKQPPVLPVRQIITREDFIEALNRFRSVKTIEGDVQHALEQMDRLVKKNETLLNVLNQRFDPAELSYKKFASVIREVEKLFYLNIRSMLNRFEVFDESEFAQVRSGRTAAFSPKLQQEKTNLYNEFLAFVKDSLGSNEEILLKLDKLLLEISRLDSLGPGDIESMPCMQEIDSLIKQTKFYK